MTETEYQYTPLRIWDLQPGQSGKTQNIDLADQRLDGRLARPRRTTTRCAGRTSSCRRTRTASRSSTSRIRRIRRPTAGTTPASASTRHGFGGTPDNGWQGTNSVEQGAFGVDVRNCDGLIVLSDMRSGLWLFKLDGFNGWNGHDYGMPNISSVQD